MIDIESPKLNKLSVKPFLARKYPSRVHVYLKARCGCGLIEEMIRLQELFLSGALWFVDKSYLDILPRLLKI